MNILRRFVDWVKAISAPPDIPERDEFHAETDRRRDTTRQIPRDQAAPPASMSRPNAMGRVRRIALLVSVAMLALSGCATLIGAVDTVSETIQTIETDFAPYIAALPPDVQAVLIAKWAEVKAAIAAASAILEPLR